MIINERMKTLLLEAAKCYEMNCSPFESQWLSDHNVTIDECFSLSEMIGLILRGVAMSSDRTQAQILIQSVLDPKP